MGLFGSAFSKQDMEQNARLLAKLVAQTTLQISAMIFLMQFAVFA